jgi:hypothetical protein
LAERAAANIVSNLEVLEHLLRRIESISLDTDTNGHAPLEAALRRSHCVLESVVARMAAIVAGQGVHLPRSKRELAS